MKSTIQLLDRHLVWRSLDPILDIWSDFVKKKRKKAFYFLFLKKEATFYNVHHLHNYLPSYPLGYPPSYPPSYPPGYPPGFLMLPNLTNYIVH